MLTKLEQNLLENFVNLVGADNEVIGDPGLPTPEFATLTLYSDVHSRYFTLPLDAAYNLLNFNHNGELRYQKNEHGARNVQFIPEKGLVIKHNKPEQISKNLGKHLAVFHLAELIASDLVPPALFATLILPDEREFLLQIDKWVPGITLRDLFLLQENEEKLKIILQRAQAKNYPEGELESVHQTVSNSNSRIPDGLIHQPILGNGHCLFNAVGIHLKQDQQFLRNIVAAHLEHNLATFRDFIGLQGGQSLTGYINDVRNGFEWATHIEIEVLMRVLNRPIIVIGEDGNIINRDDAARFTGQQPIFVYYNGHNHYDALLLRDDYHQRSIELMNRLLNQETSFSEQPLVTQLNEHAHALLQFIRHTLKDNKLIDNFEANYKRNSNTINEDHLNNLLANLWQKLYGSTAAQLQKNIEVCRNYVKQQKIKLFRLIQRFPQLIANEKLDEILALNLPLLLTALADLPIAQDQQDGLVNRLDIATKAVFKHIDENSFGYLTLIALLLKANDAHAANYQLTLLPGTNKYILQCVDTAEILDAEFIKNQHSHYQVNLRSILLAMPQMSHPISREVKARLSKHNLLSEWLCHLDGVNARYQANLRNADNDLKSHLLIHFSKENDLLEVANRLQQLIAEFKRYPALTYQHLFNTLFPATASEYERLKNTSTPLSLVLEEIYKNTVVFTNQPKDFRINRKKKVLPCDITTAIEVYENSIPAPATRIVNTSLSLWQNPLPVLAIPRKITEPRLPWYSLSFAKDFHRQSPKDARLLVYSYIAGTIADIIAISFCVNDLNSSEINPDDRSNYATKLTAEQFKNSSIQGYLTLFGLGVLPLSIFCIGLYFWMASQDLETRNKYNKELKRELSLQPNLSRWAAIKMAMRPLMGPLSLLFGTTYMSGSLSIATPYTWTSASHLDATEVTLRTSGIMLLTASLISMITFWLSNKTVNNLRTEINSEMFELAEQGQNNVDIHTNDYRPIP